MIAAVGLGALCGGVVFLLVLHLARPRTAPLVELARFDAAHTQGSAAVPTVSDSPAVSAAGLPAAVGGWVARQLTVRGIANTSLRQDLALTGRTYEQVMTRKVLFAAGGLLLALLLLVVVPAAAGAGLPAGAPIVVAVLLAGALFSCPTWKPGVRPPAGGRSSGTPWARTWTWSRWRWPPGPRRRRRCRRRRRSVPVGRWR